MRDLWRWALWGPRLALQPAEECEPLTSRSREAHAPVKRKKTDCKIDTCRLLIDVLTYWTKYRLYFYCYSSLSADTDNILTYWLVYFFNGLQRQNTEKQIYNCCKVKLPKRPREVWTLPAESSLLWPPPSIWQLYLTNLNLITYIYIYLYL